MCRGVVINGWGSRAQLPRIERWCYVTVWVSAVVYLFSCVHQVSLEYRHNLNEYDLEPGWTFLERKKDMSNFEWAFWSTWFSQLWPWLAGHLVLGLLMRAQPALWKRREILFISYSLLTLMCALGPLPAMLLMGHCVLAYAAACTHSTVVVWIVSLVLLSSINFSPFTDWMRALSGHDPFEQRYYLLMFATAMINLRYTSAALDIAHYRNLRQKNTPPTKQGRANDQTSTPNKKGDGEMSPTESHKKDFTLRNLLLHSFYLPLFFTGPLLTFMDFYKQINVPRKDWQLSDKKDFAKQLVRVILWTCVLEISLHYFYFNSIQHNQYVLERLNNWSLSAVAFASGQFFMLKYVVLFGLPSIIASLDQIKTPEGPKCIAHIYLYSHMWKYFDRGLYNFLKRHIYVPLGGSARGVFRQLFASVCCFTFVYYWHGAEEYLFWWVSLNMLGITIESLGSRLSQWPTFEKWEKQWSTPALSRRCRAVLGVPLIAMSAIAIFHFLGGLHFGHFIYQELILNASGTGRCVLCLCLYCFVQTSMEIELWQKKSTHQKTT